MRKSTVRSGMRMLFTALLLILLAGFYHTGIAGLLSLSPGATHYLYGQVIFWALVLGGLGVIVAVAGLIRSPGRHDHTIKIYPWMVLIAAGIIFYMYLAASSFSAPARYERLNPGQAITI